MKTFEKSDLFGELESTLESAIELCSKYAEKHWLMKAFQGSADESKGLSLSLSSSAELIAAVRDLHDQIQRYLSM